MNELEIILPHFTKTKENSCPRCFQDEINLERYCLYTVLQINSGFDKARSIFKK